MNTGQTMLTILALVLRSTTILSVNRNSLNNGTILRQTELGVYAVSLATSFIQKAKNMDFDEKTIAGLPISLPMLDPTTTLLTSTSLLKYDSPEIKNVDSTYDDFDDYNTFVKDTTIGGVDKFHVWAEVYYVSKTPPYNRVAGPTWLKCMKIYVNNSISREVFSGQTGTDTIKMSYIKSFYY